MFHLRFRHHTTAPANLGSWRHTRRPERPYHMHMTPCCHTDARFGPCARSGMLAMLPCVVFGWLGFVACQSGSVWQLLAGKQCVRHVSGPGGRICGPGVSRACIQRIHALRLGASMPWQLEPVRLFTVKNPFHERINTQTNTPHQHVSLTLWRQNSRP